MDKVLLLIFVFTGLVLVKNYVWKGKGEKASVKQTIIEIVGMVVVVLILEHFFPILK